MIKLRWVEAEELSTNLPYATKYVWGEQSYYKLQVSYDNGTTWQDVEIEELP